MRERALGFLGSSTLKGVQVHEHNKDATKNASARMTATAKVTESAEVVKRTTPDGHIVRDLETLIGSPEVEKQVGLLTRLVEEGKISLSGKP